VSKDCIIDVKHCCMCDSSFDEFIVDDVGDDICPKCFSTSGERLFYGQLLRYLDDSPRLLYLKPSDCLESKLMGFDISYYVKNDLEHIDFDDDFFDVVIADRILDCVDNWSETLNQLNRVLVKGGVLLLRVNIDLELEHLVELDYISCDATLRKMFYGNGESLRCFGRDLISTLNDRGFDVFYANPDSQVDNICLKVELIKDPLFVCRKLNHYDNITLDKSFYDGLEAQLDDLKSENEHLNEVIDEIFSSNSWKLSAPIRDLRSKFR